MKVPEQHFTPTPEELAKEFCLMDSGQQAEFIIEVVNTFDSWKPIECLRQMAWVADSIKDRITPDVEFRLEDVQNQLTHILDRRRK